MENSPAGHEFSWAYLPQEALLQVRICDLKLKIEGTYLEKLIRQLYQELEGNGIAFKPYCYLADEWFTPDGEPLIALPFFLAHPRLRELERQMMREVEGGNEAWAMKLLRHEAGHVLIYAYRLARRKRWQNLFGPSSREYRPESYPHQPYSRNYVHHLFNYYAQAHPEEDFSETFAVWLNPVSDWKERYRKWKVREKLEYVDTLMRELAHKPPLVTGGDRFSAADRLKMKLITYYRRKRKLYEDDYPESYDRDLKRIFCQAATGELREKAEDFITRLEKNLVAAVATWSRERKTVVRRLTRELRNRCRELGLAVAKPESQASLELASFITGLASSYRFTTRFRPEGRI